MEAVQNCSSQMRWCYDLSSMSKQSSLTYSLFLILSQYGPCDAFIASQSLFLTKVTNERRFWSFLVAPVMKRTPKTRCRFFLNSGVSSSVLVVLVAFSSVPTNPCVIISWLASSSVFAVIDGGSSLCLSASFTVLAGFTRLTKISSSLFCLIPGDFVCVAVEVVALSLWVDFVSEWSFSFIWSIVLVCVVDLSLKTIFRKIDFLLVSSAFFCSITFLASCTLSVLTFGVFCMAVLEFLFVLMRVVFCAILGLIKFPPCLMIPASL